MFKKVYIRLLWFDWIHMIQQSYICCFTMRFCRPIILLAVLVEIGLKGKSRWQPRAFSFILPKRDEWLSSRLLNLNMELRNWQAPPRITHKPRTLDFKRVSSTSGLFSNTSCRTLANVFKQLRMLSPMTFNVRRIILRRGWLSTINYRTSRSVLRVSYS